MPIYYVDALHGSDSSSGLTPSLAWKSLEEVNAHKFQPGDQILFRAGSVFHESLTIRYSGTEANPITYGSYGSGPAPKFVGSLDVTNAGWKESSAGSHVWTASCTPPPDGQAPDALYVNAIPLNLKVSSPAQVDKSGEWCWYNGKLTLWSTSNPAKGSVDIQTETRLLKVQNVEHVVVENLRFSEAGEGIIVTGSEHVKLVGLEADHNYTNGLEIADSRHVTVQGGSYHDNGRVTSWYNAGHGIVFRLNARDNLVEGVNASGNAEDGVQFGYDAGSGNVVRDSTLHHNHEDGVDIKNGSQTIASSYVYGNDQQGINAHDSAANTHISDNVISSSRWALNVSGDSSVISSDNIYFSPGKGAVNFVNLDGKASSFTNDSFIVTSKEPFVRGDATLPHSYTDVTQVRSGGPTAGMVLGKHGDDLLAGGDAKDQRYGLAGDDTLLGNNGDDVLYGGGGADSILGGNGNDWASGGTGADTVLGGAGLDRLAGGAGSDLLDGGRSSDTVSGGGGNDTLKGAAGDDSLNGGTDGDRIDGGVGSDTLTGGGHHDIFVLAKGQAGGDVITDFIGNGSAKGDALQFTGFSKAAQLSHVGGSTWAVIDGSHTETFTISGVTSLNTQDYDFV
jgi:Ca2+-binding RTX toxin-like protein